MVQKKLSGETDREQAYLYSNNRCIIPDPESGINWGPGGQNINFKVKVKNKEGGRAARDADFEEKTKGGKRIYDPRYPGERYRLPDGTIVGRRNGTDPNRTPTLDINDPNKKPEKWKYPEK